MRQGNPIFKYEIITVTNELWEKTSEELPNAAFKKGKEMAQYGTGFYQNSTEYVFIPAHQIKKVTTKLEKKGFGFPGERGPFYERCTGR